MEKKEVIKQNAEALFEVFGKDDAVLIVAHTGEPSVCLNAMKGAPLNISAVLSFAMMENPELLRMMKLAVEFVEHEIRNKKN